MRLRRLGSATWETVSVEDLRRASRRRQSFKRQVRRFNERWNAGGRVLVYCHGYRAEAFRWHNGWRCSRCGNRVPVAW